MKRVAVIGGGLAGLTSAVYLSDAGFEVDLFEASPKLGGRAYSFLENNEEIDNGQHIMMGCYSETLKFLQLIGSIDKIDIQDQLQINFVDREKGFTSLRSRSKLYPFNLFSAMLNFRAISFGERLSIIRLITKLLFIRESSLKDLSIERWLKLEKQSDKSLRAFWEILAVGIMNAGIKEASASIFLQTLRKIFLNGNRAASIIIPRTSLSRMYCKNAAEFIVKHGGCIWLSKPVKSLSIGNGRVTKILLQGNEFTDFDSVISAVPPFALSRILPQDISNKLYLNEFRYSSILSVHIWLTENKFIEKFHALIGSPVHWVFNHGSHITLVISNAEQIVDLSKDEIIKMVIKELKTYFDFFEEKEINGYKVIKEKRATFIPDESMLIKRPKSQSGIKNLILAGDWTDTKLPATIEGAVLSGKLACNFVTVI